MHLPPPGRFLTHLFRTGLLILPLLVKGQTTVAPDCATLGTDGAPCIALDARASVDSLAGPLIFRWHLGDGQIREGVQLEYCYARPGRYQLRLDVVDPRSQQIRSGEFERTLDLTGTVPALRFHGPDSVRVGQRAEFAVDRSSFPGCLRANLRFTWSFGEGPTRRGEQVEHFFRKPGTYQVRMTADGPGFTADCPFRPCTVQVVTVVP